MKQRFNSESGIAIGVILFAIAIMAAVAIAMSAGSNSTSQTITIDRIASDVKTQGMLIVSKIRQCHSIWVDDQRAYCDNGVLTGSGNSRTGDTACPPAANAPYYLDCNGIDYTKNFYPQASSCPATPVVTTTTAVTAIQCPAYEPSVPVDTGSAKKNIWTGEYPATLPAPSGGMDVWYYVNGGDAGGRCIRTQPLASTVSDAGVQNGLALAAKSFTSNEMVYQPASASQRFILWITPPSGTVVPGCQP
jgi:hypothetical protein